MAETTPKVDPLAAPAASPVVAPPKEKERRKKKGDRDGEKRRKHTRSESSFDDQSSGGVDHEDDVEEETARRERQKRAEAESEERRKAAEAELARSQQRAAELGAAQKASAAPQLDDEADEASLSATKLEPTDVFEQLPADVFTSFDKLQRFSRELNIQLETPEIVIIGQKGQGKSALVEALLGRPFNYPAGFSTRRPLLVNAVHSAAHAAQPHLVLKRDTASPDCGSDCPVAPADLGAEIARRQGEGAGVVGAEPVVLQWESAAALTATLIDTPGLLAEASDESRAREQLALRLAAPTHRTIVAVRHGADAGLALPPGGDYVLELVKQVDPELVRTVFVFTGVHAQLRAFATNKAVNRYLTAGGVPDLKAYFVTLPRETEGLEPEAYRERLMQAARRDLATLEQLQYDKRAARCVGANAFVKHVAGAVWRAYQDSAPRIMRILRQRRAESERALGEQTQQAAALSPAFFRLVASQHVTEFLRAVERLLSGTADGNPAVNGQTLEQERAQAGLEAQWADSRGLPIAVDAAEWGVPHWQNKLYGGQQFERLLAEFKAVSDHTDITDISRDDVATAAGIPKLHNVPNFSWAASDLARSKAQETFEPLIVQLTERAVYVVRRLAEIAESMAAESRALRSRCAGGLLSASSSSSSSSGCGAASGRVDARDVEMYPYFVHFVKDQYARFVERVARQCRERCMDEFYSTRTIYWDLTENQRGGAGAEPSDADVVDLTKRQFGRIKDRITRNVLLKFYNFFLVPMESELWKEMQSSVSELSDKALEDLFEISAVTEALKDAEVKLQFTIKDYEEKEKLVLQAATQFAHPAA
eukprot:m51a1_g13400 putative dynamin like protein (824) ;mRNA; r:10595-14065